MSFWMGFFWVLAMHSLMSILFLLMRNKLRHAGLNRVLILSLLLLPCLVWVPFPRTELVPVLQEIMLPEFTLGSGSALHQGSFSWQNLYWLGATLMLFYSFRGVFPLLKWARKAGRTKEAGFTIYTSETIPRACSFFRWIFVPASTSERDKTWILAHEKAHGKQGHSWDIVVFHLMRSFFWVNPFLLFMQRQLSLNHEYLADESVLAEQDQKSDYIQLIVANSLHTSASVLGPTFSLHTQLKNRITYMQQQKKKRSIYLVWIPLMLVLVTWASCSQENRETPQTEEESAQTENTTLNPGQVDEIPEMEGGMETLMNYLSNEIVYPAELKEQGKEAKVMVRFTIEPDGSISHVEAIETEEEIPEAFTKEAIRAVSSMPKWKPGIKDGKAVAVSMVLPILFAIK